MSKSSELFQMMREESGLDSERIDGKEIPRGNGVQRVVLL